MKQVIPKNLKKLAGILIIVTAIIFTSCEGPMGPPGIPGDDGEDGFIGTVFEFGGDFEAPDYYLGFEFPRDFEIYDTDIVLVYKLWAVVDGVDVWRVLPQTKIIKFDSGENDVLLYNFDYTYLDVEVFLDFEFSPELLYPDETDNQIFRIAVLPADFAALKSVNVSDFNSILQAPELELKILDKVEMKTIPEITIE